MIKQALKTIVVLTSKKIYKLKQSICRTIGNRMDIVGEDEVRNNILIADIPLFRDNIKDERFTSNVFLKS